MLKTEQFGWIPRGIRFMRMADICSVTGNIGTGTARIAAVRRMFPVIAAKISPIGSIAVRYFPPHPLGILFHFDLCDTGNKIF